MKKQIMFLIISTIAMFTITANACNYSNECPIGSACVKVNGDYRPGVCIGGNSNGFGSGYQAPSSMYQYQNFGNRCTYDSECGFGKACFNGVCQ